MDVPAARDNHIVYIVDDDAAFRVAIREFLAVSGYSVLAFGSVAEYLRTVRPDVPACLLLDVHLPDGNSLDLQRDLVADCHPPIIFVSGCGDVASSVRAMKGGALDFLPKPFASDDLLFAVAGALEWHCKQRAAAVARYDLAGRYASLTPREREVLPLVVGGLLNKQAAAVLGISIVTLQIHRGRVMKKMSARSTAELVRMAQELGIRSATPPGSGGAASPSVRQPQPA